MLFFFIISYTVEVDGLLGTPKIQLDIKNEAIPKIFNDVEFFLGKIQRDVKRSQKILRMVSKNVMIHESGATLKAEPFSEKEIKYTQPTSTKMHLTTESKPSEIPTIHINKPTEYFTDNLLKLWHVLSMKEYKDLFAVTIHFENVYDEASREGRLSWLGKIMRNVIIKSIPVSDSQKVWSKLVHFWILNRSEEFRPEVNELFDLANNIVQKEDAELLSRVIEEFTEFTAGNKSGEVLCRDLFNAFARPFERHTDSVHLVKLIKLVQSKYEAFGARRHNKASLRDESPNEVLHHIDDLMTNLRQKIKESRNALININLNLTLSTTTSTHSNNLGTRCTREISRNGSHSKLIQPYKLMQFYHPTEPPKTTTIPTTTTPSTIQTSTTPTITTQSSMLQTTIFLIPTISYRPTETFYEYSHIRTTTTPNPINIPKLLDDDPNRLKVNPGYFSHGYENWLKQVALKKPQDVITVHSNSARVLQDMLHEGQLRWLGKTMTKVIMGVGRILSTMPIDQLQEQCSVLHGYMRERYDSYNEEINEIIDFADSLVVSEDGEHLLETIEEFQAFPKSTKKTGYVLCRALFEAFGRPFSRLYGTDELRELIDAASIVFKELYPELETRKRYGEYIK